MERFKFARAIITFAVKEQQRSALVQRSLASRLVVLVKTRIVVQVRWNHIRVLSHASHAYCKVELLTIVGPSPTTPTTSMLAHVLGLKHVINTDST